MIKLVITDIDKTLLNDDEIITKENIRAIKLLKEKNILFGVASGRAEASIKKITKEFEIYDDIDFIIGSNGVSLYEKTNNEHFYGKQLKGEVIKQVYDYLRDLDVAFVVHKDDTMLSSKITDYTNTEKNSNQYEQIEVEDFHSVLDRDYPKLMIIGQEEILQEAINRLKEYSSPDFDFFKTFPIYLELVSKNISKGEMLKLLCDKYNISLKEVLSIGDNYNDLDMIKVSGYGVAVGNAVDTLKKHAKLIVGTNNENGVAEAIESYIK